MERERLPYNFKSEQGAKITIDEWVFCEFIKQYQTNGELKVVEYEVKINDELYIAKCSGTIEHFTEDDCDYDIDGSPILWNVGLTDIQLEKI